MRRQAFLPLLIPATAIMLFSSLASARPTGANTWAGIWNSDFGQLTLSAGGSGAYTGFNPGTVSGSVTGNVDKGTWNQPGTPPKSGTFTFTMSPDGQSFTGEWAYASGGCGSTCGWNGVCQSGECLKNGQAAATTTTTATSGPATPADCAPLTHGRRLQAARALKEVRVICVQGDVQFHREGTPTDNWQPLEKDSVLKAGDEVSCGPDGLTVVAFADNSTVVVHNTTQLKIASFFAEGGIVRTQILLRMGEVAATVNKSETTKSDFKIREPTAVASVRGTIFTVFYDPGSNTSLTSVQRGVVTVSPTKPGLPAVNVGVGKEVEVTSTAISPLAPIGTAGARGGIDLMRAHDLVLKNIARDAGPCALTMPRANAFSIKPSGTGWLVSIDATGGKAKGWSTWTVTGTTVASSNPLAREIAAGCTGLPAATATAGTTGVHPSVTFMAGGGRIGQAISAPAGADGFEANLSPHTGVLANAYWTANGRSLGPVAVPANVNGAVFTTNPGSQPGTPAAQPKGATAFHVTWNTGGAITSASWTSLGKPLATIPVGGGEKTIAFTGAAS